MATETRVFGLTASDLQKKIQPVNQEDAFLISDDEGAAISVADAVSILQASEDTALELMNEALYKMTQSVAESLTDCAQSNDTAFATSLYPLMSIRLYKNFTKNLSWDRRTPADALDPAEYTVDMTTGEITLSTPLSSGDTLYADYQHKACRNWESVKTDILAIAALELSSRYEIFANESHDFVKSCETARYNLKDRKRIAGLPDIRFIVNSPFSQDFYAAIRDQTADDSVIPYWWL